MSALKVDVIAAVPYHTRDGVKKIEVAALQVNGAMVLMAFEETYVNKSVEIGKMSTKLLAQLDHKSDAIAEAGDAAREQVQGEGQEAAQADGAASAGADLRGEDSAASN
jgi:hypothetical protein